MIRNRLTEINKIVTHMETHGTQVFFGYIPSQYNPADCATRGLTHNELQNHFWWSGPPFLHEPTDTWFLDYQLFHRGKNSEDREKRVVPQIEKEDVVVNEATTSKKNKKKYFDIFAPLQRRSYTTIKRIVVRMLCFIRVVVHRVNGEDEKKISLSSLLREQVNTSNPSIGGKEISVAELIIVMPHQNIAITPSIVKAMQHLNIKSDEHNLARCFGRSGNSPLNDNHKRISQQGTLWD
ncbi:hypothetical protein RB195_023945 [Necator americanus]|uniref:Uncharacterized protein n=1 Tax=Necator americanus TaxID=51031 RepID=A0ABR1ELB5_NECAM